MTIQQVSVRFITSYSGAGTKAFQRDLSSLGGRVNKVSSDVGKGLMGLGKFSHMAGTALMVGVGAAMAVGIKAAIDFEDAFAGVRKTLDASEEEFTMLAGVIREMSREIPISTTELAKIAELGGQLGIPVEGIEAFTETIALLGVTTNLNTEEAATALARFANIMGTELHEFDNLGSAVVDLGNNFATTEKEILEFGLRLSGIGATIGLSEEEVLGLATAFTSLGEPAERGASSLQRIFIELQAAASSGGTKLEKFAETMGVTAERAAELIQTNPAEAFLLLEEGLGGVIDSGGDATGIIDDLGLNTIRTTTLLLKGAAGAHVLRSAIETSNIAWKNANALQIEADKRFETTRSQLQLLRNQWSDFAIDLGNDAIPAVRSVVQVLQGMFGVLKDNQGVVNAFITTVLLLGAGRGLKALRNFGGVLSGIALKELPAYWGAMGKGRHVAPRFLGRTREMWHLMGGFSGALTTAAVGLGLVLTAMAVKRAQVNQFRKSIDDLRESTLEWGFDSQVAVDAFVAAFENIPEGLLPDIFSESSTETDLREFATSLGVPLEFIRDRLNLSEKDFEEWANTVEGVAAGRVGFGDRLAEGLWFTTEDLAQLNRTRSIIDRLRLMREEFESARNLEMVERVTRGEPFFSDLLPSAGDINAEIDQIISEVDPGVGLILAFEKALGGEDASDKVTDLLNDIMEDTVGFAAEFNETWQEINNDFSSELEDWESKWQDYEQVAAFSLEKFQESMALLREDNQRLLDANQFVLDNFGTSHHLFWMGLSEETRRGMAALLAEGEEFDFMTMLDQMFDFEEGQATDAFASLSGFLPAQIERELSTVWPAVAQNALNQLDAKMRAELENDPKLMTEFLGQQWMTYFSSLDPQIRSAIPGYLNQMGSVFAENVGPLDIRNYMNMTTPERIQWWRSQGADLATAVALGWAGVNWAGIMTPPVQAATQTVVRIVRRNLEIESPSKVFARIGEQSAMGFHMGFTDMMLSGAKTLSNSILQMAPQVNLQVPAQGTSITINNPQHKDDDILDGVKRATALAGLTRAAEVTPGFN